MRPVRLTMQAFGPYAGRAVVDFREAIASGLFGIYGPTGSGKSSIFSAMTFALFGEAAKAEQDTTSLRSDHADATLPTEVEFVFDIGAKRYVLRRRPEQTRPKQRGEGETRDAHEAWLFDATGLALEEITEANPGKVIAEKKTGHVRDAVTGLLGYGAEQFRQIVLLPQGKFETFMAAKTDKRLEILRELFDVSMYRRMAAKFKEDAAAAEKQVRQEREICAKRLSTAGFESPDALHDGIEIARAAHEAEALKETEASQALEASRAHLADARKIEDQFQAVEKTERELEALVGREETIRLLQERVDNALRAQALLDVERHALAAQQEAGQAAADMNTAIANSAAATDKAATAAGLHEAELVRSSEVESLRQTIDELQRHQKTLGDADGHALKAADARAAVGEAKRKFDAVETRLADMLARKADAERALSLARENDVARQRLQHAVLAAESALKIAESYGAAIGATEKAAVELQAAKDIDAAATRQLADAKDHFEAAERALADAQAVHLAAKLSPGDACPVCGSVEHPLPAAGGVGHAGLDQAFRQTKVARDQAQARQQETARQCASAEARWQERRDRLDQLPKPEQAAGELRETIAALNGEIAALGPIVDFTASEAGLVQSAEEIRSTETERDTLRASFDVARTEEALARDRFEQAIAVIPEELRSVSVLAGRLAEKVRELTARAEAARAAEENARTSREAAIVAKMAADAARQAHEKAELRREQDATEFQRRLEASGFGLEQFQQLKQWIETIEADAAAIAEYRSALAVARNGLDAAKRAVEGKERPDVAASEAAHHLVEQALDLVKTARAEAQAHLRQLEALKLDIANELRRLEQIETETGALRTLAALFNADNPLRLDLETYAIGAMFDQVLLAANHRLGPMSGGRFSLEREIEGGSGRSRRGLGIRVFDVHTGKARATATLSGGETFMAALALALGLSDIVESTSGQVRLDTIFIDEGFGSLDTENESGTLDQVLQVLSNLAGQRRVVGLISHVPLVQETIPNGFYIRKQPLGSVIEARGLA